MLNKKKVNNLIHCHLRNHFHAVPAGIKDSANWKVVSLLKKNKWQHVSNCGSVFE